jgi:hypothetical protein
MSTEKLLSRGLIEYLHTFDIVMLSETRLQVIDKDHWTQYKVFFHPASRSDRAGEGMMLCIRYRKEYHILPYCTKQGSLWAKLQFREGGPPLIIGTTYIPPTGSPLLRAWSLSDRISELQKTLGKAKDEGFTFLGGDLNSRVGPLSPMASGGDTVVNAHGRRLLRVAHKLGVYICTGRVPGDIPAGVSCHGTSRSAATLLDHLIVSPNLLPHLQHSGFYTIMHVAIFEYPSILVIFPPLPSPRTFLISSNLNLALPTWNVRGPPLAVTSPFPRSSFPRSFG